MQPCWAYIHIYECISQGRKKQFSDRKAMVSERWPNASNTPQLSGEKNHLRLHRWQFNSPKANKALPTTIPCVHQILYTYCIYDLKQTHIYFHKHTLSSLSYCKPVYEQRPGSSGVLVAVKMVILHLCSQETFPQSWKEGCFFKVQCFSSSGKLQKCALWDYRDILMRPGGQHWITSRPLSLSFVGTTALGKWIWKWSMLNGRLRGRGRERVTVISAGDEIYGLPRPVLNDMWEEERLITMLHTASLVMGHHLSQIQ